MSYISFRLTSSVHVPVSKLCSKKSHRRSVPLYPPNTYMEPLWTAHEWKYRGVGTSPATLVLVGTTRKKKTTKQTQRNKFEYVDHS